MIAYLAVAVMPGFLALFCADRIYSANAEIRQKSKKKYLFLCGLILFFFMALRSNSIGSSDAYNYYNMMRRAIASNGWEQYYNPDGVEPGFQLLLFLLSRLFNSPQAIIVFSAAIYVISIIYTIYHNSDDVAFSLTMYITLGLMQFEMQGMRQSIAISICFFAYEFAKKRKLIPFLLLVLLAMQFHQTAIVFAAVYFIFRMKYRWNYLCAFVAAAGIACYSADAIIGLANNYFDRNYYISVNSGGFIATAIYLLIIVFAFFFNRKLRTDRIQTASLYLTMTGCICYLIRYIGTLAAERISFYFMFGQLILLPNTMACLTSQERQVVKFIVYILMFGLFAYRLNGSDFLPYRFFWQ